ncbi:hypothetical protein AVEN_122417-1 [Araneus ventricosus]|uniref:Uncharacterized protein n=1 Tax=Araneus ventricosus TaxID=182803 RepID=A0A4Y2JZU6_ARAVE|nr:hypothetical protein AVEN_122417-1 [Araneus ventricosus]
MGCALPLLLLLFYLAAVFDTTCSKNLTIPGSHDAVNIFMRRDDTFIRSSNATAIEMRPLCSNQLPDGIHHEGSEG